MNKTRLLFIFTALTIMVVYCNPLRDVERDDMGTGSSISDCGGFSLLENRLATNEEDDMTRDEVLIWEYDAATKAVSLLNQNVWLNCCGEHDMHIVAGDNSTAYDIYETDQPERAGRCSCMCFFDYQITLPNVQDSPIHLKLIRWVEDNTPQQETIWTGELDLTETEGTILIQSDVGYGS